MAVMGVSGNGGGTAPRSILLAAVTNAHHSAHPVALEAISSIPDLGPAAHQVAPVVATRLSPTNSRGVQLSAIVMLGNLKAAPEISVAALASSLKNPDPVVKVFSTNTLGTFGAQASTAIPALTNVLVDPDTVVRTAASNALNQIDPLKFPSPYGP